MIAHAVQNLVLCIWHADASLSFVPLALSGGALVSLLGVTKAIGFIGRYYWYSLLPTYLE